MGKKKLLVKNSALWEKSFVFWLFGPRCSRPLRSPVVVSGTASELLLRRTFHFPSSSQVKKKKKIPSLPLISPFFRYAQRAETCQFFQSCFLPRSFRHARPFKNLEGWNPAERAKVTACAPEAERSRNVGCLFSYRSAVMNGHSGPCKLALAVQHNPHFQYQSASVKFITTRCCRSCLKKAAEGLSLQLITSGCEPSGQAARITWSSERSAAPSGKQHQGDGLHFQ